MKNLDLTIRETELLEYINKVVQIWLLATTGISAITTTIIMIEYSFVIVTDLKKKIKK